MKYDCSVCQSLQTSMFKSLSGNVFLIGLHYFCVNFTVLLNIFLTVILCKRTFSGWNCLHELLSIATLFLFMLLCFSQSIVTVTDGDFVNRFNSTLQMVYACLLYTSPSPRDGLLSRMPSSA